MTKSEVLGILAKSFAVATLSLGTGFLAGAISFLKLGHEGSLYGSPFGHISDVIGWGTGFLTASLATFVLILLGRRDGGYPRKPAPPHGLE